MLISTPPPAAMVALVVALLPPILEHQPFTAGQLVYTGRHRTQASRRGYSVTNSDALAQGGGPWTAGRYY